MELASYAERRKRLGDGYGRWATGTCSWRFFRNAVRDNLDVHNRRSTSTSDLRSEGSATGVTATTISGTYSGTTTCTGGFNPGPLNNGQFTLRKQ